MTPSLPRLVSTAAATAVAATLLAPATSHSGTVDDTNAASLEDPLGDVSISGQPTEAQVRGTDLSATGIEVRHGKTRSKDKILLTWTVDDFYDDYAADEMFVELRAQLVLTRLRKNGKEKAKKMSAEIGFDNHGDWAVARPTKPGRRGCTSSTDTPGDPLKGHTRYIKVRRDENTFTLILKTVCFSDPTRLQSISDLQLWADSFTDPANGTFDKTDDDYPAISMLPPAARPGR